MDLSLPLDILYECLFFLKWNEYYNICKLLDISNRFAIYFKNSGVVSIYDICNMEEENLDIVNIYIHIILKLIKLQPAHLFIYVV